MPEDCVQFWASWCKRKLELLKIINSVMGHKNYEEIGAPLMWRVVWKSQGELFSMYKYLQGGHNFLGDSGFQWCLVTGSESMGTNWNTGDSLWTSVKKKKKKCFMSEWLSTVTGTDFPKRLLSLDPWNRDNRKLPGHCCGQPVLDCPAWAGAWTRWFPEVTANLSPSVVLLLCCGVLCNYSSVICFLSFFQCCLSSRLLDCLD